MLNSIAVLITCHNRKEKTLSCLHAIYNQVGLGLEFCVEVFLVDDASTDGTSNEVRYLYPDVTIIQGDGKLYWNRGMHLAWETASSVKDYDYYLWLNDDTFLFKNAIEVLLTEKFPEYIVCGTTKSKLNLNATYGAYISKPRKLLIPNGKYQNADYCNGNCVLIPRYVFQKLGNLDPVFHHALGDYDYGFRAKFNGIEIKVSPDYVGICENHDYEPKWRSSSLNIFNRLKNLYHPLSGCNPCEFFVFEQRHNGIFKAIQHLTSVHLRCFFPALFK